MAMMVETRRLALRPVEAADAAATARLMTPMVAAELISWPSPMTAAQAAERIERSAAGLIAADSADLAILDRRSGALLGWIGAAVIGGERRLGTLGYWLGEDFHDQGYMTEAARAAVPWFAQALRLDAIEACIHPHNFASQAIVEGLGFQLKGRRRIFADTRGAEEDFITFAVPSAVLCAAAARRANRKAAAIG